MSPKVLKFRAHLVPLILSGSKKVTWRLFDEKHLQVGDELVFQDSDTGKDFATAEVLGVREKTLGKISSFDYQGHEKFHDQEDMLRHYKAAYGERVDLDTKVKIVTFKLVEKL
ncbi:MAG: ASCH domain-containing protein [Patescibacteria group bacterium]|jgi:hypothetical protein